MDVTGISVAKAQEIADASIVEGEVNPAGNLVLTTAGGVEFNAGQVTRPPQIDILTNTAITLNWVLPPGALLVHVQCIGGGGGGAAGTVSGGDNASGGGGSGGGWNELWIPATGLVDYDDIRIDVGEGGTGGGASGFAGDDGEFTEFFVMDGANHRSILTAPGGLGGLAVSPVTSGEQPVAAAPNIFAGAGGSGRGDFATPSSAPAALRGGGGGGGGINSGSATIQNGGVGGGSAGGSIPPISSSGVLPIYAGLHVGGGGGMGGGSHTSAPIARPGENGGPHGGGGGGGAGVNLQWAVGGNGASGACIIITYF